MSIPGSYYQKMFTVVGSHQEVVPGFPGGAVVENLPADARSAGSSPGLGGSHMPRSKIGRAHV